MAGSESMRHKIIRILWSDPLPVDSAIASSLSLMPGVYYITKIHGDVETSLYIGKASNTIRERLKDHQKKWLPEYHRGIQIRMGKIIYPHAVDPEIIDHAESALIYEHRDVLLENTDKRNSYSYSELYRIENTGNIGNLKPIADMHIHPDY